MWSVDVKENSESKLPRKKVKRVLKPVTIVGWREWLRLPDFCETPIKVKVDTGARSSCLHAFNVEVIEENGQPVVYFDIHPIQNSIDKTVRVSSPLIEYRTIRSSSGHAELRPVIRIQARVGETNWPIEITLTNRDQMGFRMLLGRRAMAHRFIVDPAKSFVQSPR
jgi:hypothetical protein